MTSLPRITDQQRRARLVARHHLAGNATAIQQTVRDLLVLHASDPVSPVLALWARIPDFQSVELEDALYEDRSLWRLHAMRRTIWITDAADATKLDAAAGRKIAAAERKRLVGWLGQVMAEEEVEPWLATTREEVLVALSRAKGKFTTELTELIPAMGLQVTMGNGKWAQETAISTRLLYTMAMELELVRGRPKGSWRGSQFQWERSNSWFGDNMDILTPVEDEEAARAWLCGRYLDRFGPVTRDDIKWFTGWTVPQTMDALLANGALEVSMDRREIGWVLPADVEVAEPDPSGVVRLLPGLDPTPMGYKDRRFMVGPHAVPTFDETGNIGPTVWCDGKVVGAWASQENGRIAVELLEDIGEEATEAVTAEAARLTKWLGGTQVMSRFPSILEKELRVAEE